MSTEQANGFDWVPVGQETLDYLIKQAEGADEINVIWQGEEQGALNQAALINALKELRGFRTML